MTDRVVKVSLQAQVSNYLANMEAARKGTKKVTQTLEEQKAASIAAAKAQGEAAAEIGRGMVAIGALAAVGVALAVKKFADFDEAMSNVKAATQETTENMGMLRDAALSAGARTVFSATEAANAIEELGKAGLSTSDILSGGLDGALDLASAGQLGVAEAAGIAATAMKTFNLRGSDMSHVADLLAAGAGKAMGDVSDLSQALAQAGLVANATGISIEETTGTLAAFASKGLLGSDAGTSFKAMLQRLTPISAESKKEMDRLGISAFNAAGEFIGMEKFAGNLQTSLKDLSAEQRQAALTQIFGSDAVRAATVLYDEGAKGIRKWNEQTNDSGFAAKVAADRLDNLKGDVEQLGGAFDTYLIKSGSGANDVLRLLTQGATGLVTAVGDLPEPVLAGGLAFGGLIAAIGLAGGAALIAVPKIAQFKVALATLNISGVSAAKGIGLASGALAVAGIAFSLWASRQAEATSTAAAFADSLDKTTGAVTDYTRELVAKKLAESGAFDAAKNLNISQKELTDAVLEGGDALDEIQKKFAAQNNIVDFFNGSGIAAGNANQAIRDLSAGLERGEKDLKDQNAAAKGSAQSTQGAADAYQTAADNANTLQSNLSKLLDTINKANGVGQDAVSQNIAYRDALSDVDAQIAEIAKGTEGYSAGLSLNSEAGRANLGMLNDLAAQSQAAAKAQFDLDGNTANYKATLEAGRKAVIDRAIALGATADEAQNLADKIYAIPAEKEFRLIANLGSAQRALDAFFAANNNRTIYAGMRISNGRGGGGNTFADGGTVFGPGTSKSDSVPIMASRGEEIIQEPYASMHRALLKRINAGTYRGYASGGTVGYAQPQYASPQYASPGGVNVSPQVSLAGATLLMSVDGRQMTAVIQEQIVDTAQKQRLTVANGSVRGR